MPNTVKTELIKKDRFPVLVTQLKKLWLYYAKREEQEKGSLVFKIKGLRGSEWVKNRLRG